MIEMVRVRSSAIQAIGYDSSARRLRIRFSQGEEYDFCGVPSHVFDGLLGASSKGRYYDQHIRDRHRCW